MTYLLLLSDKNFGGLVYFDGFSVFTLSCLLQFCYGQKRKTQFFGVIFRRKTHLFTVTFYRKTQFFEVFFRRKTHLLPKKCIILHHILGYIYVCCF